MAMVNFNFADDRPGSEKFYEGYAEALDGAFILNEYSTALQSKPNIKQAGFLAGTKARFGELPTIEFTEKDSGYVTKVGPMQR